MESKAIKICATITSVILSILLTALMIALPIYYSVTILVKPHGIVKIVQKVDYKQILSSNKSTVKALNKLGVTPADVDNAIKDPEVGKVLEECTPTIVDFIEDIPENGFSVDTLTRLTEENFDRVVQSVEENSKIELPDKKLKAFVTDTIKKNEKAIESVSPQVERVVTTVKTVTEAPMVKKTVSPWFGRVLIIEAVLIAAMIFILCFSKTRGFVWLGVIASVSAIVLAFIIIMGERIVIDLLTKSISDFYSQFLGTAVSVCNQRLGAGFSISAFIAVACFAAYGVLRNKLTLK